MLSQTSESPVSWHICELMWHMWLISVCKAKATPKHLKLRMIFLAFPFDPHWLGGDKISSFMENNVPKVTQDHGHSFNGRSHPLRKANTFTHIFYTIHPIKLPPPNWQCSRNHPFFLCSSLEYHQQCGLLLPNKICVIGVTHNVPNPFQQFITLQT